MHETVPELLAPELELAPLVPLLLPVAVVVGVPVEEAVLCAPLDDEAVVLAVAVLPEPLVVVAAAAVDDEEELPLLPLQPTPTNANASVISIRRVMVRDSDSGLSESCPSIPTAPQPPQTSVPTSSKVGTRFLHYFEP